jgi:hypothetical protein
VECYQLFVAALRLVTAVPGAQYCRYKPPPYLQKYQQEVWPAAARQQVVLAPYVNGTLASVWFEAVAQQMAQNMGQHVLGWAPQVKRIARAALSSALQHARLPRSAASSDDLWSRLHG